MNEAKISNYEDTSDVESPLISLKFVFFISRRKLTQPMS